MKKAASRNEKIFFTIKEISIQLDLPPHVLRFWEKQFLQINPSRHNNRRYYTIQDIRTIKAIKHLLYNEGFTIEGAKKEMKSQLNKGNKENIEPQSSQDIKKELLSLREDLKNIKKKLSSSLE